MSAEEKLDPYLADGENIEMTWRAQDAAWSDEHPGNGIFDADPEYTFGATDRRILFTGPAGEFTDLDYDYVRKLDVETVRPTYNSMATFWGVLLGLTSLVSGIILRVNWWGIAIGLLLLAAVGNHVTTSEDAKLTSIRLQIGGDRGGEGSTGGLYESSSVFVIYTDDGDVGPELSGLIRESA